MPHETTQYLTAMPKKLIKKFRLSRNISQEKFAFQLSVSQTQISKYETGENVPNSEMLIKMAKLLEIEVFELFYENSNEIDEAYQRWKKRNR